jgi:hypothetical protein
MYLEKFCIALSKIVHASKIKKLATLLILFILPISADSFNFNTYNNHGVVGLINMPTARLYEESVHGMTFYDGTPDQKITLTSNPFNWMEASFFYTSLQNRRYCGFDNVEFCKQDYKDKGFNLKLRLKEEGVWPAIAIGFNDFAGTGLYSSEYIVSSYGINNLDIHFGLGWGSMNSSKHGIKNPLGYLSDSFYDRPIEVEDKGGQFQPSRYFSGKEASLFFGIAYSLNKKTLIKVERDTIAQDSFVNYKKPSSEYSFGIDYAFNDNFSIGLSHERGAYSSVKFIYKNNPKSSVKKFKYKKASNNEDGNKYEKFIKNLEENGIGVNKISETASSIGIELTQFVHPDLDIIEKIISSASMDAGINKNIKKDLKVADLKAISEIDSDFEKNSKLIYERRKVKSFNTSTGIKFRPFLASREDFFKGAIFIENDSEFIIRDNLFFNTNLKYSLVDNLDDLIYPPVDTFPAQVRSDVKEYLKNIHTEGILIGRAQLDYHLTPKKNHHLMITAGILEDMFSGYGFEYLYFKGNTNYAIGFELFDVQKRDYKWKFGTLGYENITGSLNFYYRNYGYVPFDMKISYGEYLAGDRGSTIEFSRTFENGTRFGVFASFTNVTAEEFGEGSFDKGVFFNIPIYGNFINYTWKPLTKDPGAKLNRRNSLYDLLVKFRPLN